MTVARQIYWVVILISATAFFGSLFVKGLRQRKVISTSNLDAERDRTPVIYWTYQIYYALAVLVFVALTPLIVTRHKFGTSPFDMPMLALAGILFLLGAVLMVMNFVVGLRTGVAVRRTGPSEPRPPSRKEHPIRYWGLQISYILFAMLMTALGTICMLEMSLK